MPVSDFIKNELSDQVQTIRRIMKDNERFPRWDESSTRRSLVGRVEQVARRSYYRYDNKADIDAYIDKLVSNIHNPRRRKKTVARKSNISSVGNVNLSGGGNGSSGG